MALPKSHLDSSGCRLCYKAQQSRWRDGLMAMPLAGLELTLCVPGIPPTENWMWNSNVHTVPAAVLVVTVSQKSRREWTAVLVSSDV
jgi:hypothetical protein